MSKELAFIIVPHFYASGIVMKNIDWRSSSERYIPVRSPQLPSQTLETAVFARVSFTKCLLHPRSAQVRARAILPQCVSNKIPMMWCPSRNT
ncbi:hypothetical protein TcasGA2_TC006722 [Tribolium castaneum]|uniref:Uncharacterized protein n=1 Tax=Tribolium castaneum TaxID=7070 RepID=D6WYW2_TRICA|nr:hypothetical protein TcasGA2_TC006722 [Tribolium castaneum]